MHVWADEPAKADKRHVRYLQVMGCPEDEARWFFQQFIIGLDYCHKMGIANRDIKVRPTACHTVQSPRYGAVLQVAVARFRQQTCRLMANVVAMQLDNVLLHGRGERPVVKICDFGYSKDEVAGSICKTACGTPEYMAPEVRHVQHSKCSLS
jgi:serine/threonine-protein kinase SRK2